MRDTHLQKKKKEKKGMAVKEPRHGLVAHDVTTLLKLSRIMPGQAHLGSLGTQS